MTRVENKNGVYRVWW